MANGYGSQSTICPTPLAGVLRSLCPAELSPLELEIRIQGQIPPNLFYATHGRQS
nr:hypothetical protein Q903MT_gene1519 [Picea sitchensis]